MNFVGGAEFLMKEPRCPKCKKRLELWNVSTRVCYQCGYKECTGW